MGIHRFSVEIKKSNGTLATDLKDLDKQIHVDFLATYFRLIQTKCFDVLRKCSGGPTSEPYDVNEDLSTAQVGETFKRNITDSHGISNLAPAKRLRINTPEGTQTKGSLEVQAAVDAYWNQRIGKEYEEETATVSASGYAHCRSSDASQVRAERIIPYYFNDDKAQVSVFKILMFLLLSEMKTFLDFIISDRHGHSSFEKIYSCFLSHIGQDDKNKSQEANDNYEVSALDDQTPEPGRRSLAKLLTRSSNKKQWTPPAGRIVAPLDPYSDPAMASQALVEIYGRDPGEDPHWTKLAKPTTDVKRICTVTHDNVVKLIIGTLQWNALITSSMKLSSEIICTGANNFSARPSSQSIIWGKTDWERNLHALRQLRSKFHRTETYDKSASVFYRYCGYDCCPVTIFGLSSFYADRSLMAGIKAAAVLFGLILDSKSKSINWKNFTQN
ncbi:hypothetical protein BGZ76_006273 [Entomortierella beljakovae]|nr:hypothetical protein BGZ76_006273 [Entomortierella beljakovae]